MPALAGLMLAAAAAAPATAAASPAASPVTVQVAPSKTTVAFGEPFGLVVQAKGPTGTSFRFPGEAQSDAFELHPLAADATAPAAPEAQRYEAVVFASGELTLPPIPVRYRLADGTEGEAASPPLRLEVTSLLPKDPQQQKLADIRGPRPVSVGRAFWVAVAAAALLLAALATWLIRRRRPKPAAVAAATPALAPDVEALQALDALAAAGLLASGEYRAFYIRLTALAKRYLERRLDAPVLEMTSAETLAFLRRHPQTGELLPTLRELAEAADRVKFARAEGLAQEAERHLAAVRTLVPALEARLRPAPPAAEGKAA